MLRVSWVSVRVGCGLFFCEHHGSRYMLGMSSFLYVDVVVVVTRKRGAVNVTNEAGKYVAQRTWLGALDVV